MMGYGMQPSQGKEVSILMRRGSGVIKPISLSIKRGRSGEDCTTVTPCDIDGHEAYPTSCLSSLVVVVVVD